MKITVEGTDEVMAMLDKFSAKIESGAQKGIAKGAMLIADRAKALAPYDTGELYRSINSKAEGMSAEVGTNVEYAMYQEFGTYKMAAHPYLIPAMEESEAEVCGIMKKAIGL